ncbi:MAG: hypothetical protein U5L96_01105 [Owenweeksia sp.]|nr:hypothetical protein [Owenweeksia sp.]
MAAWPSTTITMEKLNTTMDTDAVMITPKRWREGCGIQLKQFRQGIS